jgi:hypothetical protein
MYPRYKSIINVNSQLLRQRQDRCDRVSIGDEVAEVVRRSYPSPAFPTQPAASYRRLRLESHQDEGPNGCTFHSMPCLNAQRDPCISCSFPSGSGHPRKSDAEHTHSMPTKLPNPRLLLEGSMGGEGLPDRKVEACKVVCWMKWYFLRCARVVDATAQLRLVFPGSQLPPHLHQLRDISRCSSGPITLAL